MTKKKTSKRTPPKQTAIPGSRPARNKTVDAAAEKYVEARDSRLEWQRDEIAAHDALVSAMKYANLKHYETDEHVCDLDVKDPTEKVKVKARKVGEDE